MRARLTIFSGKRGGPATYCIYNLFYQSISHLLLITCFEFRDLLKLLLIDEESSGWRPLHWLYLCFLEVDILTIDVAHSKDPFILRWARRRSARRVHTLRPLFEGEFDVSFSLHPLHFFLVVIVNDLHHALFSKLLIKLCFHSFQLFCFVLMPFNCSLGLCNYLETGLTFLPHNCLWVDSVADFEFNSSQFFFLELVIQLERVI